MTITRFWSSLRKISLISVAVHLFVVAENALAQEGHLPAVLPDPTRPFSATTATANANSAATIPSAPLFVLQAVIKKNDKRKAMINGRWLVENQTVQGATLVKINEYSVLLNVAGQRRHVALQPTIITHSPVSGEH